MEVKSALWQKLFMLPISLLFCGVGVACMVTPFVPSLSTPRGSPVIPSGPADFVLAALLGLFMLAFGFGLWWPVVKYSIRADEEGIIQTNGFFQQSVRWTEVATYYMANNPRHHKERRLHVEPVMLNAEGIVVFQGFAHLLVSTRKILEQRRELWRFVEAQLEGKKVEPPAPKVTAKTLAVKSLEVDWSKKSLRWKIVRFLSLTLYALFWLSLSLGPSYYFGVVRNEKIPGWAALMMFVLMWGPLLPHLIWIQWKRRQIAKTMKGPEGESPLRPYRQLNLHGSFKNPKSAT